MKEQGVDLDNENYLKIIVEDIHSTVAANVDAKAVLSERLKSTNKT